MNTILTYMFAVLVVVVVELTSLFQYNARINN